MSQYFRCNSKTMACVFTTLVLSLSVFVSCDSDNGSVPVPLPDAEPITLKLMAKVETDNSFAFDLFRTTHALTDEANLFISPLSVNMALSMMLNGAKGTTLEEMKTALRASNYSLDEINEYNKSLKAALVNVDKSTTLSIANAIWYHNTVNIRNEFVSTNQSHYDAAVQPLDFTSLDAVSKINQWVSGQTNHKIPEIIDRLTPESRICLINAIYFKGLWKSPFDKNNTQQEVFYSEDKVSKSMVNMMRQTAYYGYNDDENGRYLKLSYGNWAYSMIIMLPVEGKTVDDIITNLDNESWGKVTNNMNTYEVNLRLPRFTVTGDYRLEESVLPAMGMNISFSDNADFSGITNESLKISMVKHKTFVEVNEEGTEAAAATFVEGDATAPLPGTIIDYVVNKPFAFAIQENSTGVILFMGKVKEIDTK